MRFSLTMPFDKIVTVSDASEGGGGACYSVGLAELDIRHFGSLNGRCLARARDIIILISLFDGIGGGRRALELLGC
jgi:hypothetical protein